MAASPRPNRLRNDRVRHRPVVSPLYRVTATKQALESIIRDHDFGSFYRSAGFMDEMLTDDRVSAVMETRASALLASPLQFRAANSKRKAARIAEVMGGTEDDVGLWPRVAPPDAIAELLTCGRMLGVGIAEIVWSVAKGQQVPRLVPVHLHAVRYDHTIRRLILAPESGPEIVLPDPSEAPRGDAKWFIYTPYGLHNGWRRGMIRSLGDHYIKRRWNYRDWARYCEKHGMALIEARFPAGADEEDIDAFADDIGTMGSEPVIMAPQGPPGDPSFGVDIKEATAQTWQTFLNFKQQLDTDIAIRVLGQNLTTDNTAGGGGGSRALGEVQNLVRMDKLAEDAKIATALRDQVLSWWAEWNFGDAELAPVPEYMVAPPEDEKAEADTLVSIGAAVRSLRDAGIPVDALALAEKYGIPLLDAGEEDDIEEEADNDNAEDGTEEPGGGSPAAAEGDPKNSSGDETEADASKRRAE